jgi:hypothetical protein
MERMEGWGGVGGSVWEPATVTVMVMGEGCVVEGDDAVTVEEAAGVVWVVEKYQRSMEAEELVRELVHRRPLSWSRRWSSSPA